MRSFVVGTLVGACAASLVAYIAWPVAPAASAAAAVVSVPTASSRVSPSSDSPAVVAAAAPAQVALAVPAPAAPPSPAPPERVAIPVAMSAEHAKILAPQANERPLTLPELHATFISEGKDPTWSQATEQSIGQALAAANAAGDLQIMNVDCRVSMCEVLAFGNSDNSSRAWNGAIGEMRTEPWYSDIGGESTTMGTQNGRNTVVTIFQRKKH